MPKYQDNQIATDSQYVKDWLEELNRKVKEDDQARQEWSQSLTNAYRLRYMLEWRRVEFPWPGAADIVMPLIDMMCDRMKPSYLNLITQVHPPVTVLAADKEAMNRASTVEMWFDWLVRAGSPNFVRECAFAIDDLLETGRGILKSLWHYEVRTAPETISLRRLPPELQPFVVPTKRQLKMIDQLMVQPEIRTVQDFNARGDEIDAIIEKVYALDPDGNDIDKKALAQIKDWLRAGAEEPLTFKKRDIVTDAPGIVAVHPNALIVPSETTSVEDAEHLTHVMYMTERQLRHSILNAGYSEDVVEAITGLGGGPSPTSFPIQRNLDYLEQEQAIREGVGYRNPRQYTIYESCCWMDIDRDGFDEKVVCTWSDALPDRPLKLVAYERPSGKWPYHSAEFELNKRRWYAPRGIPNKLADLQKEWTIQHRSKLNRMLIANAPTFVGRMNSMLNWQTQRWIPGQILWSLDPARDIMPLQVPNLDMSFQDEENYLRTVAEIWMGSADYGNVNPMSSLTEPRTATEIRGIQSQTNLALSMRGTVFQLMMSDVYREMFDLWQTWGNQDISMKITGGEEITITKEDLQGQYVFQCTGRIGEADPFQESARALARLNVLMQLQQAGVIGQPGQPTEVDWTAATLDYLEKDEMRIAHRIIREKPPEQVAQEVQEQEAMMALQGHLAAQEAAKNDPTLQNQNSQSGGGSSNRQTTSKQGGKKGSEKKGPRLLGQTG